MLFAESNGDKDTFQKLWDWTSSSLQRGDRLFSWRWSPKAAEPVADKNNAADGDILIAWALTRAAKRWEQPRWAEQSRMLQGAILEQLAIEIQGRMILQPGAQGFVRKERWIVNLSYYIWPAIRDFAEAVGGEGRWRRLEADGLWLLDNSSFGTYQLPPDWLSVGNQELKIADGWPPYFGFDAVRNPTLFGMAERRRPAQPLPVSMADAKIRRSPTSLDQPARWVGGAICFAGWLHIHIGRDAICSRWHERIAPRLSFDRR